MNVQTVVFIGRSGCGKGTQASQLIEFLKAKDTRPVFHLEAGAQFRKFLAQDYYSSELSRQISTSGSLQPEFLAIWAWSNDLVVNMKSGQHLLIDGTPRRLSEAKILESVFGFFERSNVDIIYLNVSRDWAIDRMRERGRTDDKSMTSVISRLVWFETDVVPAIDYYRAHKEHKFHEINGEQTIEKVHEDILKALGLNDQNQN